MIKHVHALIAFALANLLALAISIFLAALASLPFALLGGYLASQWLDHPPNNQTDVSLSVQGAGIFLGASGGFAVALLTSLALILPRVCRVIDKWFFPQAKLRSPAQEDT